MRTSTPHRSASIGEAVLCQATITSIAATVGAGANISVTRRAKRSLQLNDGLFIDALSRLCSLPRPRVCARSVSRAQPFRYRQSEVVRHSCQAHATASTRSGATTSAAAIIEAVLPSGRRAMDTLARHGTSVFCTLGRGREVRQGIQRMHRPGSTDRGHNGARLWGLLSITKEDTYLAIHACDSFWP